MNRTFKLFAMCMTLASLAFVSCEKDGKEGNENGNDETKKVCFFNASIQMSEDFLAACESLSFEYKDTEGVKVKEVIDASKLKRVKYNDTLNEDDVTAGKDLEVLEWSCSFDYKNSPAEVYFKPTMQLKESVSYEDKADFIFHPIIVSGVHNVESRTNYGSGQLKLGVRPEGVSLVLNNLKNTINSIEVNTTVGE